MHDCILTSELNRDHSSSYRWLKDPVLRSTAVAAVPNAQGAEAPRRDGGVAFQLLVKTTKQPTNQAYSQALTGNTGKQHHKVRHKVCCPLKPASKNTLKGLHCMPEWLRAIILFDAPSRASLLDLDSFQFE